MARHAFTCLQSQLTSEDLEKRGFAGAIGADQHGALTALHFEVEVFVNHMLAVGLFDSLERDHTLTATRGLWKAEVNGRLITLWGLDPLHAG